MKNCDITQIFNMQYTTVQVMESRYLGLNSDQNIPGVGSYENENKNKNSVWLPKALSKLGNGKCLE